MAETERLAWDLLRVLNRTQAKGSTVRLVVPRAPEVVEELGVEPDEARFLEAVEYLLERGYLALEEIDLTGGAYTITSAGLRWRDSRPPGLPGAQETTAEEPKRVAPERASTEEEDVSYDVYVKIGENPSGHERWSGAIAHFQQESNAREYQRYLEARGEIVYVRRETVEGFSETVKAAWFADYEPEAL